jgi:hypothetical protein
MSAPVLQFATLDPEPVEKKLIVNGRYRIPDPLTDKPRLWTRATTFAGTIADAYNLERWKQRNLAVGLVLRQDLYASVAAAMPADLSEQTNEERERLNGLCRDAMDAAGSAKGSNLGSALHTFTEKVDAGQRVLIPAPWDRDIAVDRINHYQGRQPIGDVKTAKSLDFSWTEIAIQLALYAHAETIYTPAPNGGPGVHEPMPEVDQEIALIMHLPVGRAECFIYQVDIAAGWEAAQLVLGVRNWRKRRDLAQQVNLITKAPETDSATEPVHISQPLALVATALQADPFAGLPDENGKPQIDRMAKRAWLLERRETLIAIDGGREALAAVWPTGVPTLMAADDHTADQLHLIDRALWAAEGAVTAPLPEREDPTDAANIAVANDDARVVELKRRLDLLPPDLAAAVAAENRRTKACPNLDTGRLTVARLAALEPIVAAAENEYAPRAQKISGELAMAAEKGVSEAALCAVLGVPSARHIHGHVIDQLVTLADALGLNLLKEVDGVIVVDNPASILSAEPYRDNRSRLLSAGREVAKAQGLESPKDSDACLSHPLIAAYLAVM